MDPGTRSISTDSPSSRVRVIKQLLKSENCSIYSGKYQGNSVVVKKVDKTGMSDSEVMVRKRSEVELPQRVVSEQVLRVLSCYEEEKSLWVVLEMCEGGNLKEYLEGKKVLAEEEVSMLGREVALGLEAMHGRLIVHRNLSLSSILLTSDGHAVPSTQKIGGFKSMTVLKTISETRRTPCGSSDFSCAEMTEQQPYSLPADVWSLGCIIYACLCGSSPFQGFPPTSSEIAALKISPRLPTFFSVEVRDLLTHLLDPDPIQRYTIQQALRHPFFNIPRTGACSPTCVLSGDLSPALSHHHSRQRSRSADSLSFTDKFIYEYKETFSPVKDSIQLSSPHGDSVRRNLQFNSADFRPVRTPLSTANLPLLRYDLAKSSVWISADGTITYQSVKTLLVVSGDGRRCWYGRSKRREYSVNNLPEKIGKFYDYLCSFVSVIRAKTPYFIYENKYGTFTLMADKSHFEAYLQSGERIRFLVNGKDMHMRSADGSSHVLRPWQDWKSLSTPVQTAVEASLKGLKIVRELCDKMAS